MKFRQLDDGQEDDEGAGGGNEHMAIGAVQEREREKYWDDLSGKPLIPELVRKARLEEL